MFNRNVVHEALKQIWANYDSTVSTSGKPHDSLNVITSLLIHDIFGGEILKTQKKEGWHFYNLIDGERIDFTISETDKPPVNTSYEDISSSPDETNEYLAQEDYSTYFMRFVMAFEEAVGLEKYKSGYNFKPGI
jgi:hypothetical protein